jgi:CBS domain-containing protein
MSHPIKDFMTHNVVTVNSNNSVFEATEVMVQDLAS